MNTNSETIQDKLALLRQSYRDQLPTKIDEIKEAARPPATDGAAEIRRYLETLGGLAHKLAGSGATFGFPDISVAARALEQGCEEALSLQASSRQTVTESTTPLIESLQKSIADILADTGAQTLDLKVAVTTEDAGKVLLIVSDDDEEVKRLSGELENSGFDVRHANLGVDLEGTINQLQPSGIVIEISTDGQASSGLSEIHQFRQRELFDGPLIITSDSGDIHV